MPIFELMIVVVLTALAWLWFDSLKAREAAVQAGREACAMEGVMLLDDTVAICSLKPVRDDEGRLRLQRAYEFEYSDNGNNRLKGSVVVLDHRVVLLNVGLREASTARTLH